MQNAATRNYSGTRMALLNSQLISILRLQQRIDAIC